MLIFDYYLVHLTFFVTWFSMDNTISYVVLVWRNADQILTHWCWHKMAAIFQMTFSNAFSWMKMYEFWLSFHWSLFPRVQSKIFQHWCWYWFGAGQATSHYLNQWWLIYWHIYASLNLSELNSQKTSHIWPPLVSCRISKLNIINTLRPRQKGPPFRRQHFQMHFLECKC